jgi:hypothetical protein
LLTVVPVLVWAIRGLTRLHNRLIPAVLGGAATSPPVSPARVVQPG